MNRFTIGGGLYSPLEVEIDGQVFRVRKISRAVVSELDKVHAAYEAKLDGLDETRKVYAALERSYEELGLMLGPEAKGAIEGLDIREASEVMTFITSRIMNPEKKGDAPDPEKNAPKPGDVTAP